MCGVKLKDRLPSKELRERLGVDDIALVLQQNRLRWYGHVLRKDDDDWVKKCMARIRIGWNKFRQLVPLLTNKDV